MEVSVEPYVVGDKHSRLFTLTMKARETKVILESPYVILARDHKNNIDFQIFDSRSPASFFTEEKKCFRPMPEDDGYFFYSPSGFQTDEEHLDWLIELKEIPMVFGENDTVVGFVQFKKAA